MSRVCEICSKSYKKGNLVSKGIGQRVSNRAIKKQKPNLRNKKIVINGSTIRVKMCASCLKRIKFETNLATVQAQETEE